MASTKANLRQFGVADPDQYWRERVAASRAGEKRIHRFLYELIESYYPKGGNVLDCGVGDGHVFRLCRQRYQTYGVEFSKEAIQRLDMPTERIAHFDLNNGLPEFGVLFDAIVVSMVLHWLDDPKSFLQLASTRLKPGGRLLVVIPNVTFYRYRIRFLFGHFPEISLSHRNVQTPAEAEGMFQNAGLAIERILGSKRSVKARLWPRLFATSLVYLLQPKPPCAA